MIIMDIIIEIILSGREPTILPFLGHIVVLMGYQSLLSMVYNTEYQQKFFKFTDSVKCETGFLL